MRSLLLGLAVFLLYLLCERIFLHRSLRRIPLRIAVTGTRGKSSVARILASILSESGKQVLAKTTGSKALLLLPDGSQAEIRRRGMPSILEQIRIVTKAARLRADCLIAEIMSIHPENHYFEAQRILKPHIVALTNIRLDHTEAMGESEEEIASVLAQDFPPRSIAFVPEQVSCVSIADAIARSGSTLIKVFQGEASALYESNPELAKKELPANLDLACSVARHLNIDDRTILRGILKAQHDIGKVKVWKAYRGDDRRPFFLVNAFAANDPESTLQLLSRILDLMPGAPEKVTGILNLRRDRLPRTLQWIDVLRNGAQSRFDKLYVTGDHCALIRRRLPDAEILRGRSPEEWMAHIGSVIADGAVVFGFGNIKGAGLLLAEHWNRIGEDYGI